MGKQYAGQVEGQRKMLIQNWAVLLLFLKWAAADYWNQPTQLGPCRHGNTPAVCAGVAEAQWGSSKAQKHFWLQIKEVFCFLCVLGDLDSWVCGWLLETFPTCNKPWPKGQIFMQIALW